jgi:hypothetical protein
MVFDLEWAQNRAQLNEGPREDPGWNTPSPSPSHGHQGEFTLQPRSPIVLNTPAGVEGFFTLTSPVPIHDVATAIQKMVALQPKYGFEFDLPKR